MGSSGFWEMMKNNSKNTIEKMNLLLQRKIQKTMKNLMGDKADAYINSIDLVKDCLLELIDANIGKIKPEGGKPPTLNTGLEPVGYENISCYLIRLKKKPAPPDSVDLHHDSDTSIELTSTPTPDGTK